MVRSPQSVFYTDRTRNGVKWSMFTCSSSCRCRKDQLAVLFLYKLDKLLLCTDPVPSGWRRDRLSWFCDTYCTVKLRYPVALPLWSSCFESYEPKDPSRPWTLVKGRCEIRDHVCTKVCTYMKVPSTICKDGGTRAFWAGTRSELILCRPIPCNPFLLFHSKT